MRYINKFYNKINGRIKNYWLCFSTVAMSKSLIRNKISFYVLFGYFFLI